MLSKNWQLSARSYGLRVEEHVKIPVRAGHMLDANIFRPAGTGRFPTILSPHPYSQADQVAPLTPEGFSHRRGHMEAGDPRFYARRGYVHALLNIRGSGESGGEFDNLGEGTITDICDVIEWITQQPWSNGRLGMFGASYFSLIANRVAVRAPDALRCVFAPFAWTDAYRDRYFHGGILNYGFTRSWFATLPRTRFGPPITESLPVDELHRVLAQARANPEIGEVPFLAEVLDHPELPENRVLLELLMYQLDGDYYRERSVDYSSGPTVPGYFGACWGVYGNHLPGAFRSYEQWRGPRRLTIGPPLYLDRPLYQYAYESLRWFDHWLKDNDTGMLEEPPVNLFLEGSGGMWRSAHEWPLPETRWTPFYLHDGGLLSEHEPWPTESPSTFNDSPFERGQVTFSTPAFVEATEICGPIALTLWASTTGEEILWFASLLERDPTGHERLLTRGWLRGSQRALDLERSLPWAPYHTHTSREPLRPGETYRFDIEIRPYGIVMRPGSRLVLRLKCADDETPVTALEAIAMGHLAGRSHVRVTVYHDENLPSHLLLPVTKGNRIGTYVSGGLQQPPG